MTPEHDHECEYEHEPGGALRHAVTRVVEYETASGRFSAPGRGGAGAAAACPAADEAPGAAPDRPPWPRPPGL